MESVDSRVLRMQYIYRKQRTSTEEKLTGTSNNGAFGFVGAGGAASGAVAMLVAAFAAAFALPSGRLATPWTQLGRQVAAIRSRLTMRRML